MVNHPTGYRAYPSLHHVFEMTYYLNSVSLLPPLVLIRLLYPSPPGLPLTIKMTHFIIRPPHLNDNHLNGYSNFPPPSPCLHASTWAGPPSPLWTSTHGRHEIHTALLKWLVQCPTGPKAEIRLYDSNLFKLYF